MPRLPALFGPAPPCRLPLPGRRSRHARKEGATHVRPPDLLIDAIRTYLEREFPSHVQPRGWDQEARAQVFAISHETAHHDVFVQESLIEAGGDVVASLRASELAEYMREARAQDRRFVVLEKEIVFISVQL